jgi:hypothetical protein
MNRILRALPEWRRRPAEPSHDASTLTGSADRTGSLDSLDELDRLVANRRLARAIAKLLWQYEVSRIAAEARSWSRSPAGETDESRATSEGRRD